MTTALLEVAGALYASPLWRLPPGFTVAALKHNDRFDTHMLTIEGPFPAAVDGQQVSGVVYTQDDGRPDLWVWSYRGAAILDPIPLPPIAKAA